MSGTLERRDWLVILSVALIGVVAILAGWWTAEFRVRDAVRSYALSVAERVTEAAADILDPKGPQTLYANDREAHAVALQLLERTAGVRRMLAYDRDSVVWLDSTGAAIGRHYDQEDVAQVFATGQPLMMLHMTGGEYHVLGLNEGTSALAEIYVPIRRAGQLVGVFELYIDATDTLAAAANIARIAYAVFVVTILLAMAAILVLVWRSLLRRRRDLLAIDALRRNAEAISAELAAVNKRQERFNANAAHELRTPLAILRARLDAMAETDDLRDLKRDVDSMIRQVELLLELARTETVATGADARIDLGRLAEDMAARLYPVARRAGRDIAVDAPLRAVVVTGDPALMESAVRNLLENALRVSPAGATVRLVVAGRSAAPGRRRPRAGPRSGRAAGADGTVPARAERRLRRPRSRDRGRGCQTAEGAAIAGSHR